MSSYKDTFTNLLVKTHFTEEKEKEREYDYEGDMAMSQLKSIINNAQKLHDMLEPDTNLPEWVQLKITLAEDYVVTAANYMEGEMNEEVTPPKDYGLKDPVAGGKFNAYMQKRKQELLAQKPKNEKIDEDRAWTHEDEYGRHMEAHADAMDAGKHEKAEMHAKKAEAAAAKHFETTGKKIRDAGYTGKSKYIVSEDAELDEAQKKLKPYHWRAEWRLGTETEVDKNNKKIHDRLAKTDPEKAKAFHDNLMRMKKKDMKEEKAPPVKFPKYNTYKKAKVADMKEGANDWKKAFQKKAKSNLNKDTGALKVASKYGLMSKSHFDNKSDVKHAVDQIKRDKTIKVDEEITYFSGTTVSGKPWKFIPPAEPKMLSPEFVKDRVPTLTDKEAHEVSVVAKDQYDDVAKKFAEMSEAKAGTVPKTAKEKALAAKAHPKHLITHKDVLVARGVKLGEEELREKIREKLGAPGKTMTKKPADPVVFHPMGKKKPK